MKKPKPPTPIIRTGESKLPLTAITRNRPKSQRPRGADVDRQVARFAIARLDQPIPGSRDFTRRKRKGLAKGIERLFQAFFESGFFRCLRPLPAQGAQARTQHRERRIGRCPERKHDQGDGQKQDDCQ